MRASKVIELSLSSTNDSDGHSLHGLTFARKCQLKGLKPEICETI